MNNGITTNTRIIDLTVGQLIEVIQSASVHRESAPEVSEKRYAYGIAGIAQIFNCSISTANRIKHSGVIDEAIRQAGRIIVVDVEKALNLYKIK